MRRGYESRARGGACGSGGLQWFGRRAGRLFALLVAFALLNLSAAATTRASARTPPPAGEVTFAGDLTFDGSPAVPGQTFFPGSTIFNAPGQRSALALSNLSRLDLSGGTTLRLDFTGRGLSGALVEGGARFFIPVGIAATVSTGDASLSNDAGAAASFGVDITTEGTTVSVQSGALEMRAGGVVRRVSAGESFSATRGGAALQAAPGHSLSGRQRAGLAVGIAAAVLAIVFAITRQEDDEPPIPCEPRPIIFSGVGDPGC